MPIFGGAYFHLTPVPYAVKDVACETKLYHDAPFKVGVISIFCVFAQVNYAYKTECSLRSEYPRNQM